MFTANQRKLDLLQARIAEPNPRERGKLQPFLYIYIEDQSRKVGG
jgi:hypothetical protein